MGRPAWIADGRPSGEIGHAVSGFAVSLFGQRYRGKG
jgi:hypothetical protein